MNGVFSGRARSPDRVSGETLGNNHRSNGDRSCSETRKIPRTFFEDEIDPFTTGASNGERDADIVRTALPTLRVEAAPTSDDGHEK